MADNPWSEYQQQYPGPVPFDVLLNLMNAAAHPNRTGLYEDGGAVDGQPHPSQPLPYSGGNVPMQNLLRLLQGGVDAQPVNLSGLFGGGSPAPSIIPTYTGPTPVAAPTPIPTPVPTGTPTGLLANYLRR